MNEHNNVTVTLPDETASAEDWVRYLLAQGLRPFPIHPLTKEGSCTCPQGAACSMAGKHPRTSWGGEEKPLTVEACARGLGSGWWKSPLGEVGIALATGHGLLIADVDVGGEKRGQETLERLIAEHGPLPETVQWRSGSGGPVYAFAAPEDLRLLTKDGTLGPNIDTRGTGGMVVVPPSRHRKGGRYRTVPGRYFGEIPLAPIPAWMLPLVTKTANEYKAHLNGASAREPAGKVSPVVEEYVERARECGSRDSAGWDLVVYLRDVLGDSREVATAVMAEYQRAVMAALPKPGEEPYTREKALDQVERAYSQGRRSDREGYTAGSRGQKRQKRAHNEEPTVVRLETRRASDITMKPLRWLWPWYLPLAKATLLEGSPDKGKSNVTLDIIARITTGGAFPDGQHGDLAGPTDAVLMSCEDDPEDTIVPRLVVAGADLARVHLIERVTLSDGSTRLPSIPEDVGLLQGEIEKHTVKLVVIDPLVGYLTRRASANDDAEIRHALEPLHRLAAETGATIIAIRHFKKDRAETDPLHRGGGSIGIIAAARHALAVVADPDEPERRILGVTKHNLAPADRAPAWAYRLEEALLDIGGQLRSLSRVRWVGEDARTVAEVLETDASPAPSSAAKGRMREAYEFLEQELADGEEHRAKEVQAAAEEYGIARDTFRKARQHWGETGRIQVKKYGAAEGREAHWAWRLMPLVDIEEERER